MPRTLTYLDSVAPPRYEEESPPPEYVEGDIIQEGIEAARSVHNPTQYHLRDAAGPELLGDDTDREIRILYASAAAWLNTELSDADTPDIESPYIGRTYPVQTFPLDLDIETRRPRNLPKRPKSAWRTRRTWRKRRRRCVIAVLILAVFIGPSAVGALVFFFG